MRSQERENRQKRNRQPSLPGACGIAVKHRPHPAAADLPIQVKQQQITLALRIGDMKVHRRDIVKAPEEDPAESLRHGGGNVLCCELRRSTPFPGPITGADTHVQAFRGDCPAAGEGPGAAGAFQKSLADHPTHIPGFDQIICPALILTLTLRILEAVPVGPLVPDIRPRHERQAHRQHHQTLKPDHLFQFLIPNPSSLPAAVRPGPTVHA